MIEKQDVFSGAQSYGTGRTISTWILISDIVCGTRLGAAYNNNCFYKDDTPLWCSFNIIF